MRFLIVRLHLGRVSWLLHRLCNGSADTWTPLVMGGMTVLCHLTAFNLTSLNKNFTRHFVWLFIVAMNGNLGYEGGLGIVFGSITLFVALLCFIALLVVEQPVSLRLKLDRGVKIVRHR